MALADLVVVGGARPAFAEQESVAIA